MSLLGWLLTLGGIILKICFDNLIFPLPWRNNSNVELRQDGPGGRPGSAQSLTFLLWKKIFLIAHYKLSNISSRLGNCEIVGDVLFAIQRIIFATWDFLVGAQWILAKYESKTIFVWCVMSPSHLKDRTLLVHNVHSTVLALCKLYLQ